jgi:integrase
MQMGRPRTRRKDLPDWLHWDARRGFYFYRVRRGVVEYKGFGKITREEAIKAWVKLTATKLEPAKDGTVAELIDEFVQREIPRKLKAKSLVDVTVKEYKRQAAIARALWGLKLYAVTPTESMRADVLRMADVGRHVRKFEGLPGAVSANRLVAFLSAVFACAMREGFCTYNPCLGVARNDESTRKRAVTQADRDAIAEHAPPVYRMMMRMTEATGMRLTDVRLLRVQHVTNDAIDLKQSKRGFAQRWELTPAVRAILAEAAKLPGRASSMYVFPTRKGTPYSEQGVHHQRQAALRAAGLEGIQHRDIRKAAINEAKAMGENATDFAGHSDSKTTKKHYLTQPIRVKPIR